MGPKGTSLCHILSVVCYLVVVTCSISVLDIFLFFYVHMVDAWYYSVAMSYSAFLHQGFLSTFYQYMFLFLICSAFTFACFDTEYETFINFACI